MENEENQEGKKEIRRSLDDLLGGDTPSTRSDDLPAFREHEPMDYVGTKGKSLNQAKRLMKGLLDFYLSEEIIDKNEYIVLKAKTDVMTLSNLIFQMQIAEHAITTLARSIDAGEASPRMFEVLGGLQKTLLDIMKHQTLHMMAAEENMKKIKRDIDIYSDYSEEKPKKIEGSGTTVRGTRNLMIELQKEMDDESVDPEDFDSEEQNEM